MGRAGWGRKHCRKHPSRQPFLLYKSWKRNLPSRWCFFLPALCGHSQMHVYKCRFTLAYCKPNWHVKGLHGKIDIHRDGGYTKLIALNHLYLTLSGWALDYSDTYFQFLDIKRSHDWFTSRSATWLYTAAGKKIEIRLNPALFYFLKIFNKILD